MFGIGPEEVVVIVLLLLIVFGPGKAVSMARDLGRFVSEARAHVEELKGELLYGEEDRNEPASDSPSDDAEEEDKDELRQLRNKEQEEVRLVALACTEPPEGQARWSLRLPADKLVELEIVDEIS